MRLNLLKNNISDIRGKMVFLRVDFNVPEEKGKIKEEQKIIANLPTIRFLLRYNCKIIVATHWGRPKGKRVKKYSTEALAARLGKILGEKKKKNSKFSKYNNVKFVDDCVGEKAREAVQELEQGEVLVLQNLRFYPQEKDNDKKFAKKLARLADVYVNNAFSVCHRDHASVSAITRYLPSFAGMLIEQEVENLDKIERPQKPLVTVMGGAKVDTKVNIITRLAKKSEKVLLGGALANNFLAAKGMKVGKSLMDKNNRDIAKRLMDKWGDRLLLPVDVVVAENPDKQDGIAKNVHQVKSKEKILDIGPETIRLYSKHIKSANTLIWNGPMGLVENKNFRHGSLAIARLVGSRSRGKAFGVVGGGETLEALRISDMTEYVDWVSTGGGAMLSYLGNEKMPALKKLSTLT